MNPASLPSFRNLTVRASLLLCGVLVVVGNLIVLAGYLYSGSIESAVQADIARVTQIKLTADEVKQGFLTARRIEKEFLLEKGPELMDQHTGVIGSTIDLSSKFLELVQGNEDLAGVARELDEAMVTYADDFQKVFDLQTTMGYTSDLGLQGQMRGAIRDVEAKLNEANLPRLANTVLQLRRNEKDFLLRIDQKYVEQFNTLADEFATSLQGSGLDGEFARGLSGGFELYRAKFTELTTRQIELRDTVVRMEQGAHGIDPIVQRMEDGADALQRQIEDQAAGQRRFAQSIVIGILLAMAGVLVTAFWMITRRVAPPLAAAARICAEIAEGDLRRHIDTGRRDEIGDLLSSLAGMSGKLREVVGDVRGRTMSMNTSASEIAHGNTDLSQRTEQQAANLEETASSMEEMTSTVKQNSDNARQANQLANAAREQAEKGGQVVHGAVRAMGEISSASRRIADIIGVVDEIAFQTNLLALNAAVEAARAGEQGRGFAVVATEVRNLAQRSAQAAKEIKELISDSVDKVSAGSKLVDQSGATLAEIVTAVKKVSDIVSEIAAASLEQSEGIEQVNRAVMQMDEMTQQNAALVEQAAASAKSLEEQADAMAQAVAFFRLGDEREAPPAPARAPEPRVLEVDLTRQRAERASPAPTPAPAPRVQQQRPPAPRTQPSQASAGDDSEWEEF